MAKISDITNNIQNSTVTIYTVDETNESYHLVVTANDGYIFDGEITFEYNDQNGDYSNDKLTVSEDGKTAEITNNEYYPSYGEELNGKTKSGGSSVVTYQMTVDVTNLDVTGAQESYTSNDTINITLTPKNGYKIKGTPYLHYHDDNGDVVTVNFTVDDNVATLNKPVSELTDNTTGNPLTVYGDAEKIEPVSDSKGLIYIYAVNEKQLADFAKTRFFKTTDSETGATVEQIDLGKYVKSVRQVFYPVKTSGTPHIICGNYDTGVTVMNVNENTVNVDFGTIDIMFKNNTVTDYESKLNLFLPFVGFRSIPNDIIGSSLHLVCTIDVENGKGVYKIYRDDVLFDVVDVEPFYNYLFKTSDDTVFDDDSDSKYLYGLKPYVIYTWYTDETTGNNNVDSFTTVSDLTGYNKCDFVTELSNENKTYQEYNEIIDILKTGFYV